MISKIKKYFLLTSSTLMLAVPIAVPIAVSAAAGGSNCGSGISGTIADGASSANPATPIDCSKEGGGTSSIAKLAKNLVNIFSFIVGAVAVIMIIYGGFRYITSGGDSNSVGSAKNTLIYAIVGLIIVALAQIIVQFVLTQGNDATSG